MKTVVRSCVALVVSSLLVSACFAQSHRQYGEIQDYGDPQAARVGKQLAGSKPAFHYVQIGDSHTAALFFTDAIRAGLRVRKPVTGLGWASPLNVEGQRAPVTVTIADQSWSLRNSSVDPLPNYPLGGQIAVPNRDFAQLTVSADAAPATATQKITLLLRQRRPGKKLRIADADRNETQVGVSGDGQWHATSFTARLPFTLSATDARDVEIGGWWFQSAVDDGLVAAVGINGATLSRWAQLHANWMDDLRPAKPDVIAIAYGTNEAFNAYLDVELATTQLSAAVDSLRTAFPKAAILIVGAPEVLSGQGGACGVRAPKLDAVQAMQRQVAQGKGTLYWDWQQALGGPCSMQRLIREGLGNPDGVHFTVAGYDEIGGRIAAGLNALSAQYGK